MRAHFGWAHYALGQFKRPNAPGLRHVVRIIDYVQLQMDRYTQRQSAKFDARYGTETFSRLDVPVSDNALDQTRWGYGAINHDFFREIMQAVPVSLSRSTFVDIGSGKGAAVMMASEFAFQHWVGVELSGDLVDIAKRNVEIFNTRTGKNFVPEWVQGDFFKWIIPQQEQMIFFNNPFPEALTLEAIKRVEQSLIEHPRSVLLVFRKAPNSTGDHLHKSALWKPLRLAPYWRIYQSTQSTTA